MVMGQKRWSWVRRGLVMGQKGCGHGSEGVVMGQKGCGHGSEGVVMGQKGWLWVRRCGHGSGGVVMGQEAWLWVIPSPLSLNAVVSMDPLTGNTVFLTPVARAVHLQTSSQGSVHCPRPQTFHCAHLLHVSP